MIKTRAEGALMELWTVSDPDGKSPVWIKKEFRNKAGGKPIDAFFKDDSLSLCDLVLDELKKDNGMRWIVFSKAESDWLTRIGRVFVNPAENSIPVLFLTCVLKPVRECYRKGFAIVFIPEDSPARLPFEEKCPFRLSVWIRE